MDRDVWYVTDEASKEKTATRLHLFRAEPGALVLPPQIKAAEPKILSAEINAATGSAIASTGLRQRASREACWEILTLAINAALYAFNQPVYFF